MRTEHTLIVDAVAEYGCLPCRGEGVERNAAGTPAAWCPVCQGEGKGWTELDGDGTMLLGDAYDRLLDAGLDPSWMGLDVTHHHDGTRVETWRVYGERLWAAEATLAKAIEAVLGKAGILAAEGV